MWKVFHILSTCSTMSWGISATWFNMEFIKRGMRVLYTGKLKEGVCSWLNQSEDIPAAIKLLNLLKTRRTFYQDWWTNIQIFSLINQEILTYSVILECVWTKLFCYIVIIIFIILLQSSIFLFADWSKPYHVPAHKKCHVHYMLWRGSNRSTIKQLLTG